jgi:putative tricarboxylic transport membrane protein
MIISEGSLTVFWSNGLVGSICGLAIFVLFWPQISAIAGRIITTRAAKAERPGT